MRSPIQRRNLPHHMIPLPVLQRNRFIPAFVIPVRQLMRPVVMQNQRARNRWRAPSHPDTPISTSDCTPTSLPPQTFAMPSGQSTRPRRPLVASPVVECNRSECCPACTCPSESVISPLPLNFHSALLSIPSSRRFLQHRLVQPSKVGAVFISRLHRFLRPQTRAGPTIPQKRFLPSLLRQPERIKHWNRDPPRTLGHWLSPAR